MLLNDNQQDFVVLPCGGIGKLAKYTQQDLPEYQNNPVIEALPLMMPKKIVTEYLESYPPHSDTERDLPAHIRMHAVMRLFRYFQPWGRHFELEQRLSIALRQGYLDRNPNNPVYVARLQQEFHELKKGQMFHNHADQLNNQASGFTIIGFSGIGKTKAVERILSMYPQIIVHTRYNDAPLNFYQLSWLRLECPHDGSTKALCCNLLQAIDSLLGTTYYKENGSGAWAVTRMLPGMRRAVQNHYLGVLIVDEIQHLKQAKGGGASEMLNFFVNLVNMIGVPVVLIGTTKALPILQGEFRQARRGSGIGDMVWEQMQNDGIWKLLINGAWKYQWTKTKVEMTDEFVNLLYEESQGIIDIAIKLYSISQLRAIALGKDEVITIDVIRKVAQDSFRLVRPMLDALKSGDPKRISQYQDIMPIDVYKYLDEYSSKLQEKMAREEAEEAIAKDQTIGKQYHELVSKLIEFDINIKTAEKAARKTIGLLADKFEINAALKKAYKLTIDMEAGSSKDRRKNDGPETYDTDDLRYIASQAKAAKRPAYEILHADGYIKDPILDFQISTG